MEWIAVNWWWISLFGIPSVLGILKLLAKKTKNVKDDKIISLIIEWWSISRGLFKKQK